MREETARLDDITAAISACSKGIELEGLFELLGTMGQATVETTIITYSAAINAFEKAVNGREHSSSSMGCARQS